MKIRAIERAACAYRDRQCAKALQARMNAYVEAARGVKVDKALARKVARSVLDAQRCILRAQLGPRPTTIQHNP